MASLTGKFFRVVGALTVAFALVLVFVQPGGAAGNRFNFASRRDYLSHRYLPSQPESLLQQPQAAVAPTLPPMEGVVIVDEQTGAELVSIDNTQLFNPASNTKLVTSLAVLRKFGPDYRFTTEIRTTGAVDRHGVLHGDLYVSGHYMLFGDREAGQLIKLLNDRGIKSVFGNLYVSADFSMNRGPQGIDAGKRLKEVLAGAPHRHKAKVPRVAIKGQIKIGAPPASSVLLLTYSSPPLKHILKRMNCPSDNEMAERLGELIGGPLGLRQFAINDVGIAPDEVAFASTSGLFVNRISPRAMMTVLKALRLELAKSKLTLTDIIAVAGVDKSTVEHRLDAPGQAGSVIAKTGTLPETDSGASALSGEIHTRDGAYLFVILDMHGDVRRFRVQQDDRVTAFENAHGGPQPIIYAPILPGFADEGFWQ